MKVPLHLLAAACLLSLPACSGDELTRTFGLSRDAPDEFQVVTRAPLSIPPSMGDLPPPRPGAQRPQEMSARERGETTLAPATITGSGRQDRPSGAEAALAQGKSLLPAGVTAVAGRFGRGDPVAILSPGGARLGLGLARYTAEEARALRGRRSGDIEAILGYKGRAALIHRDDMVL